MYLLPVDAPVSSSWQDHLDRDPPSQEPGTDYACDYGTPILCADNGYVSDRKTSNGSATGRYITVELDDGRTVRYLHLSEVWIGVGTRVKRGQTLGLSGASGNGSDWYYGPHVHVTLWPGAIWAAPTIDFEKYAGTDPTTPQPEEDDDMSKMRGAYYTRASDGARVNMLWNETSGWYSLFSVRASDGNYINPMATSWETNPWPKLEENHAVAIQRDLKLVHPKETPASLASRWAIPATIIVLAVVVLVALIR